MGYADSTPHAIAYGPKSLGGLGLRSIYDEQGSSKMEFVLKHSQLHITLAWCQRMSGILKPILEFLSTTYQAIPNRDVLFSDLTGLPFLYQVRPYTGKAPRNLMDSVLECGQFSPRKIRLINYCRLCLQVHIIADLATAEGVHVELCLIKAMSASSPVNLMFNQRPSQPPLQQIY
jgi:hypothetical protein